MIEEGYVSDSAELIVASDSAGSHREPNREDYADGEEEEEERIQSSNSRCCHGAGKIFLFFGEGSIRNGISRCGCGATETIIWFHCRDNHVNLMS